MLKLPSRLTNVAHENDGSAVFFCQRQPHENLHFSFELDCLNDCIERKLCALCGGYFSRSAYYFLCNSFGSSHAISLDAAMHHSCAQHVLHAGNAAITFMRCVSNERLITRAFTKRLISLPYAEINSVKPCEIYLLQACAYQGEPHPFQRDATIVKFQPQKVTPYIFEDKKLYVNTRRIR